MRRLLVLVCTCALLAACGSDGGSKATTTTTRDPGDPVASRIAAAGLLQESDLPGFAKVARKFSEANDLYGQAQAFPECTFFVDGNQKEQVNGNSSGFIEGTTEVNSSVVVFATEAQAQAELELYRDPRMVDCLRALYTKRLSGVHNISVSPVDAPGADNGFGYLVSGQFGPAAPQDYAQGVVGVQVGRALSSVNVSGKPDEVHRVETTAFPNIQTRLRDAQA